MEQLTTHSKITTEDYLQYYMYTISTTKAFQKQRNRMRTILFITVVALAAWSIYSESQSGKPTVMVITWIILFPLLYFLLKYLEKRKYRRFFKKYISTNHQENMDKGHDLTFGEKSLTIKFVDHSTQMSYDEITEIYKNQHGIYIKNKDESSFIFPSGEPDYPKIETIMSEVAQRYQIPYEVDKHWSWN